MQKEQRQRGPVGSQVGVEHGVNRGEFVRVRTRFGAWGMIKGRLLAELVGEERAMNMFQRVESREDFDRLRSSIGMALQASLAALKPDERKEFLEARKVAVLQ